jgi:shikimate dehydrogenase
MAKAVAAALRDGGFGQGTLIARNQERGRSLAEQLGYRWVAEPGNERAPLIVNVTPIGMAGGAEADSLSYPIGAINAAVTVFDVVALPAETPLIRAARAAGKSVITGAEVIALQAAEQFEHYTGVRPTPAQILAASAFSRS